MEWLVGLAYGIGGFVLVTGVILVVLTKFATSVGTGEANTAITYGITQLGSTGMLGWLGAIIAIVIGVFFLQYFVGGKGKGRKY